jgi:hypothetical protein
LAEVNSNKTNMQQLAAAIKKAKEEKAKREAD